MLEIEFYPFVCVYLVAALIILHIRIDCIKCIDPSHCCVEPVTQMEEKLSLKKAERKIMM